jgi:hypothetical protein
LVLFLLLVPLLLAQVLPQVPLLLPQVPLPVLRALPLALP